MHLSKENTYFQHLQPGSWYLGWPCLKDMVLCRHLQEEKKNLLCLARSVSRKRTENKLLAALCSSPVFKEDIKATVLENMSIQTTGKCGFMPIRVLFSARDPALSPADKEVCGKHSLINAFLLSFQSKSMFTVQPCRPPRFSQAPWQA